MIFIKFEVTIYTNPYKVLVNADLIENFWIFATVIFPQSKNFMEGFGQCGLFKTKDCN